MNFVESFDLFGTAAKQTPCITLHGVPKATTEGAVGLFGIDVDSEKKNIYKCTEVTTDGKYVWKALLEDEGYETRSIVCSAEGNFISLSNASRAPIPKLKLYGKTKQFSTTGKNKLPYPYTFGNSAIQRGVTFTTNDDGSITAKGDNDGTAVSQVRLAYSIEVSVGKTYTLSMGTSNSNFSARFQYTKPGNTGYSYAITYTHEEGNIINQVFLDVLKGATVNETIYPIIVEGDTYDGIWEPYTGGIPSPNPNYPQALESVGDSGSVEQGVYGKNLLPYPYAFTTMDINAVKFTDNGDGLIITNGTATGDSYYHLTDSLYLPAGSYKLSGCPSVGSKDTFYIQVFNKKNGSQISRDSGAGAIFTLDKDTTIYVYIVVRAGITMNYYIFKPMLRLASITDDEYEPSKHQFLTIPTPNGLPGVPVSSGGNYTDENGQQYVSDYKDYERMVYVQRAYKYVFTGDEDWYFNGSEDNSYYNYRLGFNFPIEIAPLTISKYAYQIEARCSHLISKESVWKDSNTDEGFIVGQTLFVRTSMVQSKDVTIWTNWLKQQYEVGTPFTVSYILKTPIETPLSEEEIEAYKALRTNKQYTNIYNSDGAYMEVEYVADPKMYIDGKFAELQANILNMAE